MIDRDQKRELEADSIHMRNRRGAKLDNGQRSQMLLLSFRTPMKDKGAWKTAQIDAELAFPRFHDSTTVPPPVAKPWKGKIETE